MKRLEEFAMTSTASTRLLIVQLFVVYFSYSQREHLSDRFALILGLVYFLLVYNIHEMGKWGHCWNTYADIHTIWYFVAQGMFLKCMFIFDFCCGFIHFSFMSLLSLRPCLFILLVRMIYSQENVIEIAATWKAHIFWTHTGFWDHRTTMWDSEAQHLDT